MIKAGKSNLDDLFEDLIHPNPNISKQAYIEISEKYQEEAMPILLSNLSASDIELRRISVKALGAFGVGIVPVLCQRFKELEDRVIRTSIFKIFVQIAAGNDEGQFPEQIFDVIDIALKAEIPELTLTTISLLRQLNIKGLSTLIRAYENGDSLAKLAAKTAIGEIDHPIAEKYFIKIL